MNHFTSLSVLTVGMVGLCSTAHADYTPTGQEVSAAIEEFCTGLRDINKILNEIYDRSSADAAAAPLRKKMQTMYSSLRRINEISLNHTPSDDDHALLIRQVLDLQLLQGEFEQCCLRLSSQNFYNSVKLARLFHSLADLYRQETMGEPIEIGPEPAVDEEKQRKREEKHRERLKLYGKL